MADARVLRHHAAVQTVGRRFGLAVARFRLPLLSLGVSTMPLVLCEHCWAWVEPNRDACTDCHREIDLTLGDPGLADLGMILGSPRTGLGEVRVFRRNRPDLGDLWETSEGLVFLPHVYAVGEHRTGVTLAGKEHSRPWRTWTIGGWRGGGPLPEEARPAAEAAQLTTATELVDAFLDSPGSFFVARSSIRTIQLRRDCVEIDRRPAVGLRLQTTQPAGRFRALWNQTGFVQTDC